MHLFHLLYSGDHSHQGPIALRLRGDRCAYSTWPGLYSRGSDGFCIFCRSFIYIYFCLLPHFLYMCIDVHYPVHAFCTCSVQQLPNMPLLGVSPGEHSACAPHAGIVIIHTCGLVFTLSCRIAPYSTMRAFRACHCPLLAGLFTGPRAFFTPAHLAGMYALCMSSRAMPCSPQRVHCFKSRICHAGTGSSMKAAC